MKNSPCDDAKEKVREILWKSHVKTDWLVRQESIRAKNSETARFVLQMLCYSPCDHQVFFVVKTVYSSLDRFTLKNCQELCAFSEQK